MPRTNSKAKPQTEQSDTPLKDTAPQPEAQEKTQQPSNKYARRPKVRPTIGRDQIGGPKTRVTPKFNTVRTVLN